MNRKFEDKLAELAFGDLSPEEANRLERDAAGNPEAQRTLSMYRDMKDGLKSLAEVPEDQFSKERLRDAILMQGLKPVAPRPVSSRAWLWMPCAALLIGFGYTVVRQNFMRPTAAAEIVTGPSSLKGGTPLTSESGPIRVAEVTPPADSSLLVHRSTFNDRHGERSRDAGEVPPNLRASVINNGSGDGAGFDDGSMDDPTNTPIDVNLPASGSRFDNRGASAPVPRSAPVTNVAAAHSGPIVMIDQNKDEQTGAEDATEVSSASNVLVGG